MLGIKSIGIDMVLSPGMTNALMLWRDIYENNAPWLNNEVVSIELASSISSEISRMVTIESTITVNGSTKADYISDCLDYFRRNKKEIVEIACAVGGMYFKPYYDGKDIKIDYIYQDEAIPFKWDSNREITSVIFPSFIIKNNKRYTRLEVHDFGDTYVITNRAFESKELRITNIFDMELGNEIALTDVEEWSNIEPEIIIEGLDKPLFSYFRIPLANNIDRKSPVGMSVYARAVEDIKKADIQMSRLDWEFESKETAIEVAESYLKKDAYGHEILPKGKEKLYRRYEGSTYGENDLFKHYSPDIREQSYINGLNKYKQEIEFKCGLAYGTLSDPQSVDKTATEILSSRQRSYQLISDIQLSLQGALEGLIAAINNLMIINNNYFDNGTVDASFKWDDSTIIDSKEFQQQSLLELNNNLIDDVQYYMNVYGYTEEQAIAFRDRIKERSPEVIEDYVEGY